VVVKKDNPKEIIAALMAPLGPQIPRATLRLAAAGMVLPARRKRARAHPQNRAGESEEPPAGQLAPPKVVGDDAPGPVAR
jgi:hypothetical protein